MSTANQNLYEIFARRFAQDRTRICLLQPRGESVTYAQVLDESARLAWVLTSLGARPGDRVAAQVPKSAQALWLYLACLRAGLVFHPLNDAYQKEELAYLVADAGPTVAVCHPRSAALFAELGRERSCRVLTLDENGAGSLMSQSRDAAPAFDTVHRRDSDLAVLLYTSGTTGQPKGAMITHGNLAANAQALADAWEFTATDRLLHALPIYHAHGLFAGVGCALMSGTSMVFLPRFDAGEVIGWLPECTVMMGVPTYYSRLLSNPNFARDTCRNVRLFISGSAPLSPELFAAFRNRTGQEIVERYGMTETGMNTSSPLHGERRPGSVGRPLTGVTVRIAGAGDRPVHPGVIGEIQLCGPNVFPGYWQRPDSTASSFTVDGFFRTGDQGFLSEDGYLTIAGRSRDLVITGGLNVYPREVENVIDSLPGVAESAVIGLPHPDFDEGVVAVVVTSPAAGADEHTVIGALRGRLAAFKIPKRVFFVPGLPRNSMGKVQKATLQQQYADTFVSEH